MDAFDFYRNGPNPGRECDRSVRLDMQGIGDRLDAIEAKLDRLMPIAERLMPIAELMEGLQTLDRAELMEGLQTLGAGAPRLLKMLAALRRG